MILECPYCQKKHNFDPERIPPSAKKARCKQCGNLFPLEQETPQKSENQSRIIAVSMSKGGVGKTTTAVNLAAGLALTGSKVLLVDADMQGQLSYCLGMNPAAGLVELITEELEVDETIFEARENLWLLAGGRSLTGIKRMIERKGAGGEQTFRDSLQVLDGKYDYIIIDTSPGWDILNVAVLFWAKEVLTPVALQVMALQGLLEFIRSLSVLRKIRKDIAISYILPTFLDDKEIKCKEILAELKGLYGKNICTPIPYNTKLSEMPSYGKTVFEYAPNSQGAEGYRNLARQITNNPALFS